MFNLFQIRSCPGPEWFFPDPDPAGLLGEIETDLGDAVLAVDLEGVGGEGGEPAHRHVGNGKRLRARGQAHWRTARHTPHPAHSSGHTTEKRGVLSRVADPAPVPYWIRIQSSQRIRILIQNPDPYPGGKNKWPTEVEKKIQKFHVLKCWRLLL